MNYVMVTGPMGAGKSTFMRSLPKPQGNFIVPDKVPDMWLDFSCEINGKMFYEIDAPTATGKMWIDWLKAADIQIIVGNGLKEPDEHFLEFQRLYGEDQQLLDSQISCDFATNIFEFSENNYFTFYIVFEKLEKYFKK